MASLFDDEEERVDTILDSLEKEVDAVTPAETAELTPRTNDTLYGHDAIETSLLQDALMGRLPHALILAGPSGIGKATLAFRLARFLFTQAEGQQESLYVAPAHPVFRRVASGGHADLLTVEREFDEKKGRYKNEISVEAVRRIHPFLRMTAAENGWRVVIIDGAEYLNTSSQNALLKILEEPPTKTLIILTTNQPGAFLPTIRSRCRIMQMEPLSEKTLGALLDKMAPGINSHEKLSLSRLAQGSIGRALRLHQEEGLNLYRQLFDVVSTMPALDMVKVHDLAEKLGKYGAEQNYVTAMDMIAGWCERQARAAARGESPQDILPGDAELFNKIDSLYPSGHFVRVWEKITQLISHTDTYNLDKRQAVIGAFLALHRPDYQGLNL